MLFELPPPLIALEADLTFVTHLTHVTPPRIVSWTEAIFLALAAAAGGGINAVAGGGTLVTFPALLFFGTPAINANATSTLALVIGTSGSLFGYRRHLPAVRQWLWRFIPISIIGGVIGALLLTRTSNV